MATAPLSPRPLAGADIKQPRLMDQLRQQIRCLHYSRRTEEAYVHWVRAFIRCHGLRHPAELGQAEVEAFLSWLAAERAQGIADVEVPFALERKYPRAGLSWSWR